MQPCQAPCWPGQRWPAVRVDTTAPGLGGAGMGMATGVRVPSWVLWAVASHKAMDVEPNTPVAWTWGFTGCRRYSVSCERQLLAGMGWLPLATSPRPGGSGEESGRPTHRGVRCGCRVQPVLRHSRSQLPDENVCDGNEVSCVAGACFFMKAFPMSLILRELN